jgi:hypothetical protein
MDLQVLVDPALPAVVPDAVSFECGATLEQASVPGSFVYEHHGKDFKVEHLGALTRFFEDVMLGPKLPKTFATHAVRDIDTVFAITLFLNRDLALVPSMVGLVAQVDLIHRRGVAMLGHVDPFMVTFVRLLRAYFPEKLSKAELGQRIGTVSSWIRDLATEGAFPSTGKALPQVRIIDRGTTRFAVAETEGDLVEGWVVLFSMGFVRGVLVGPEVPGDPLPRRQVVAARKSGLVSLDLNMASVLLNKVEAAMGEPQEWTCTGDWLFGPKKGTVLTLHHMLEIFLRV